jgi:hypothetical protein
MSIKLDLRAQHALRVFENKGVRIFELRKDEQIKSKNYIMRSFTSCSNEYFYHQHISLLNKIK